jgi:plastocyanin
MTADDSAPVSRRGFIRAATGAAAAGTAVGTAAGQEDTESDGNESGTGGNETGGNQTGGNESQADGGGGGTKEVIVGPDGNLVFDPADIQIEPGTTVVWTWDSPGHNVVPQSQPGESDWEGHEPIEGPGFTHEHTFEVEGTYDYICEPHEGQGMVGTIQVGGGGGEGGGGGPPQIPDSAKTLGIASVIGMLSTLGLAYFFLRFGGGNEV